MRSDFEKSVVAADLKAQYDEQAKRLLANKSILAHILAKTVTEFKGMKPTDIVNCIEGDPLIGTVPIDGGLTNVETVNISGERVVGFNTENSELREGMIRFDIVFYVRLKNGISQIIVNIEAQKDSPVAYSIFNRGHFYACRLVSSQKGRDFVNMNYDDIKKVYSIWICLNQNTNYIEHIRYSRKHILGNYDGKIDLELINIALIGISKDIPKRDEQYELHRLLAVLLSKKLAVNTKLDIIKKEYEIPMIDNIDEGVSTVCNLSEGIWEDGVECGIDKSVEVLRMHSKGYTTLQIADATGIDLQKIETILGAIDD